MFPQEVPGPKRFGHAPRLGETAAGPVRRIAIENFTDRAETGVVEMAGQGPSSQLHTVPW